MGKLLNFAGGWKTYLVGLAIVGIAVVEGALGVDIPGVEIGTDWLNWMLSGLGLIFLRKGVTSNTPSA